MSKMMSFIRITFLALVLCISPSFALAVSLTLEECVDRGMAFNPQVKAYRLAVGEAEEGISEAWGAFLPTVSVAYSDTYLKNDANALDRDYRSQDSDRLTLSLSQPLFSGMGGVAGLNKARKLRSYREYDLLLMKRKLAHEIHASFYDILQAEQIVGKWTESVKRLESQKDIAEAWIAQELAPRLRYMEIESELYNALQELASAKSSLAMGEARLRELLALEENEPVELIGQLDNSDTVKCGSEKTCLEQALSQRPEIKLDELNIGMAREEGKIIISRNLPRVSLDANRIDYTRDFNGGTLDGEDYNYYTLALNVSMKPFQGGRNLFAYRRQKLTVSRLENGLFNSRAGIVTEVKSRYQQFLEGKALVESAAKALAVAREIYNFTEQATKLGASSLDDLLNAELRLSRSEVNKIEADFALQRARINLDYAAGEQLLEQ